jgi:hypothetical protein
LRTCNFSNIAFRPLRGVSGCLLAYSSSDRLKERTSSVCFYCLTMIPTLCKTIKKSLTSCENVCSLAGKKKSSLLFIMNFECQIWRKIGRRVRVNDWLKNSSVLKVLFAHWIIRFKSFELFISIFIQKFFFSGSP